MIGLIKRLREATAPSRELDAEIAKASGLLTSWHSKYGHFLFEFDSNNYSTFNNLQEDSRSDWPVGLISAIDAAGIDIPAYSASVDAAIALAERVLPGWRVENLCEWDAEILRDQGPWMCDLVERGLEFFDRKASKCSHAATPALALCIAVLKAIQSQEPNP